MIVILKIKQTKSVEYLSFKQTIILTLLESGWVHVPALLHVLHVHVRSVLPLLSSSGTSLEH